MFKNTAIFVFQVWLLCLTSFPGHAQEFYAVAEREGTVAICMSKGALLFPDRCKGSGRISIVQPIKEGAVVWRSAIGTVSLENPSENPECALSHAKWDPKNEEVISTGRKIAKVDRANLLARLKQSLLKDVDVVEDDIMAFALDLDGDGKDETVFEVSNLKRLIDRDPTGEKTVRYFAYVGALKQESRYADVFYGGEGDYSGGTDTIGDLTIKGVVPIAPGTGELALLMKVGSGLDGKQTLIRYRSGLVLRIETIEFTCN